MGDKVWLDLDPFYPPPHMHPNTVFKAMAIAFQALGADITYVDLMGVSAAAFRIQVGDHLCPSSPHPHLGFFCAGLAQEALGYGFVEHEWEPRSRAKVKRAKEAVVASIDSGKPLLYALDTQGNHLGRVDLRKSDNRDWEDLASFVLDGEPYLLVADIGDNDARHKKGRLYIVEEPAVEKKGEEKVDWEIEFRYPDGPRDAESVAVDIENRRVLILSKRDIPPVLYEVPLRPDDDDKVTARWLGTIDSLPKPSRQDVEVGLTDLARHGDGHGVEIVLGRGLAILHSPERLELAAEEVELVAQGQHGRAP